MELIDIVEYIERNLNKKATIKFLPIQPGDVEKTNADIEKSRKMLGYNPTINVNIGIEKFIKWYKEYNSIA